MHSHAGFEDGRVQDPLELGGAQRHEPDLMKATSWLTAAVPMENPYGEPLLQL